MNRTSRTLLFTLSMPLVLAPQAPIHAAQAGESAAIIIAQDGDGQDREQRRRELQQRLREGRREQEQPRERQRGEEREQRGREDGQRAREQRREQPQRAQEERREQEPRSERRQRAAEPERRGRDQEQRAREQRREQPQRAQEERRDQEPRSERRQRAVEQERRGRDQEPRAREQPQRAQEERREQLQRALEGKQEQRNERRQRAAEQERRGRDQEPRAREQRREQPQRAQEERREQLQRALEGEQEQRNERRQRAVEQERRGGDQEQRAREQRREQPQRAQEDRREDLRRALEGALRGQEQGGERRQRAEQEEQREQNRRQGAERDSGERLRDELRAAREVEDRILERRERWLDEASRAPRGDVIRREDDRIIIRENDRFVVRHDDSDRFRWRARDYDVRRRDNGWTETVVVREGDMRVVTVTDEYGRIVRRYREYPDQRRVVLFDNRPSWWRDEPGYYLVDVAPPVVSIPYEQYVVEPSAQVYEALTAPPIQELEQRYTLDQVLANENLRAYMPRVDLDAITFEFGSSEIADDQIDQLEKIGTALEEAVAKDPNEVFLIEGHTDAVGSDLDNLALSDRRAEAVALILADYFEIPPENLVTQGYGEQYLKVNTQAPERENRRVALRRITPLLVSAE